MRNLSLRGLLPIETLKQRRVYMDKVEPCHNLAYASNGL